MIGLQSSAVIATSQQQQQQQQQPSQSNQMSSGPGATGADRDARNTRMGSPREPGHHLPQLSQQHCHNQTSQQQQRLSMLGNQSQSQSRQESERTQARAIASSSSPSPTSGHHNHHKSSPAGRRVSSPGYHSAASSPGSSVSSMVSSSASSSGVSSAASEHHLQRPIPSPTCSMSSSSSGSSGVMLTPITTMAQLNHQSQHHDNNNNNNNDNSRQLAVAAAAAAAQAISCAAANTNKLTTTTAQIAISGFPPAPHQASHQARLTNQPSHLQQHQQQLLMNGCGQPNLLDYYPEAQQDGLNLSWFHGANSRQSLNRALAGDRAIVTGDISLAELSRYPVPIMAKPPLGVSDLTLENWLSDVIQARKGIKLTFTSTRTVEPAFRVLARHAEHLKGPIILSADILTRPASSGPQSGGKLNASAKQQQQQPVDAWTFLMLCRTRFPKSIISIGWCSAAASQQQQQQQQQAQLGAEPIVQQADSSTAAESMFELDMMLDGQQQAGAANHFGQPLLHLPPTSFNQRPSLSQLSVVQQLAAVAAAAAANQNHHQGGVQGQSLAGRQLAHGYILSSTGSMNSSSGNSSGSPSPTSPLGHILMSPANQQQQQQMQLLSQRHNQLQRHLQMNQHHLQPASAEQLMFAAAAAAADNKSKQQQKQQMVGWPAVAALVAASTNYGKGEEDEARDEEAPEEEEEEEEEDDDEGQLPLNLNINEADPQHASQTLSELAAKIKSLQQESNNLNAITSSLNGGQPIAALSLASKLFSVGGQPGEGLHYLSEQNNKWEHVSKKAALANRLNSNSPSPVSTSPKSQHQNNLLCVRGGNTSLANLAAAQHKQQQQQHPLNIKQEPRLQQHQQQTNYNHNHNHQHHHQQQLGYTREMIDKMASLVKEYNLTQPITFPVEARLLSRNSNSLAELQRLLYQVGANSSLTIVAQPEDLITVEDLLTIRKHFATNQILFDLPDELTAALRHELEMI